MKPGRLFVLAIPLLLLLAGCSENNDDNPVAPGSTPTTPGAILVTVYDSQGHIVPGATVITNPRIGSGSASTDGLGQVLYKDVPIALYAIAATHRSFGSARDAANVTSGSLTHVDLHLVQGVFLEPQVHVLAPSYPANYSYIDSLNLFGSVSDIQDPPDSLTLRWSSSVEGVLSTAAAQPNGYTYVAHGPFPVGNRWITLRATNRQGLVGADSVFVSVQSFLPTLQLSQPGYGSGFRPGDQVTFFATVGDRETPLANLQVVWRSNLDGVLHTGPPAANGVSQFTSTTLSRGVHWISVAVTDGDNHEVSDSVSVHNDLPQSVALQPLTAQAAGLLLTWTPPNEPDFAEYHIYRSTSAGGPFTLINILPSAATTEYSDGTATLGTTYYYRVGLLTTTGAESMSNVQSGVAGVYIALGASGVNRMIVDGPRHRIYALDTPANSLLFIDLDSLKVTKKIFIGSGPADLDIDKAGTELFVANFGSSEIAVVDLTTQAKTRSLIVDTGGIWNGNPYRITCLTAGRLAWTSLDQWNSIRLVDTQTGTRFGNDFGSYYYPELVSSPDGTRFFVCESGSSGSKVYRLEFPGDALQQTDQTPGYGYGYSTRLAVLSGDGTYLYYAAKKLSAGNLGVEVGTFPELIYAVNQDGSLAIGDSHVYDGTTFGALGTLPVSGTLKELNPDGHTLYTYTSSGNRIYVLDVNAIAHAHPMLQSRVPRSVILQRARAMGGADAFRASRAISRRR